MTVYDITNKVQLLRSQSTDEELVKRIGISKPTLYKRLKDHQWKKSEVFLISHL